jgi:hypothetical protein
LTKCEKGKYSAWQGLFTHIGIFQKWNIVEKEIFTVWLGGV